MTGGNLTIIQKGDTYGGQLTCTATNHSYIMTFNSVNSAGDGSKPLNEKPDSILMLMKTDGNEEQEDLICIVSVFGNMLCNLNPEISQADAYNEVLSAMQSAEGSSVASSKRTYEGIQYSVAYTSGLFTMAINR